MNRWIRRAVVSLSISSALALTAGGVALAQQEHGKQLVHGRGHGAGLFGEALKLDTLTAEQRAAIAQLVDQRRAASVPVRAADAQVLTTLAQEVEQATIDRGALAPALSAEESAAVAQSAVERDVLNRLHVLLTPAQRNDLADRIEVEHSHKDAREGRGEHARWGGKLGLTPDQKAQIAANLRAEWQGSAAGTANRGHEGGHRQALESFRGDSFDASTLIRVERRGERAEKLAEAMVPVLTPAQRGEFAKHLRARAARESHG